jgi:hypothetical protein
VRRWEEFGIKKKMKMKMKMKMFFGRWEIAAGG